jgi:Heavy metal binding domain
VRTGSIVSSVALAGLLSGCTQTQPASTTAADHSTSAAIAAAAPVPSDPVLMCPMERDVRSLGPGQCPKCGMALVAGVDRLLTVSIPTNASMQIVAALPDGQIEPLLWLYEYQRGFQHPFFLRALVQLPAGTTIEGVAPDATIRLVGIIQ